MWALAALASAAIRSFRGQPQAAPAMEACADVLVQGREVTQLACDRQLLTTVRLGGAPMEALGPPGKCKNFCLLGAL